MSEEITLDDILWQLEKHPIDSDYVFGCEEVKIIYDSIIKLKKENERMTRTNKHWRKMAINNFSKKKQLKEEIKKYINSNDFVYDELYKKRETIEKILGDKENE